MRILTFAGYKLNVEGVTMKKLLILCICFGIFSTISFAESQHMYIVVGEGDNSYVIDQQGKSVDFESLKEELKGSFYYENTIFPEMVMVEKEVNGEKVEAPIYRFGIKNYKDELLAKPIYDKIIHSETGYVLLNAFGSKIMDEAGVISDQAVFDLPKGSRIVGATDSAYIYELANGIQGLIKKSGEILESAKDSRLTFLDENILHYRVNYGVNDPEKAGIYGVRLKDIRNGKVLVESAPGTMGHRVSENLYAARNSEGRWYLIDYDGETLKNRPMAGIEYVNIGQLSDGLIAIAVRNESGNYLWGYMNEQEKVIIPPQFNRVGAFKNNFALVESGGKKGLINKNGQYVILPELDKITPVKQGDAIYYSVKLGDFSGLMDKDFQWVVKPRSYTYVTVADEGIYVVRKDNQVHYMGLLDHKGKKILACEFNGISKLTDTLFILDKSGKSSVEDIITQEITPLPFAKVRNAGDGYLAVSNDGIKWGISSFKGELITELKYDRIGMFRDYASKKLQ